MGTKRKRAAAAKLKLIRPKWVRDASGQKTIYQQNDHGRIIGDRIYHYHHTKGWRSARAPQMIEPSLPAAFKLGMDMGIFA